MWYIGNSFTIWFAMLTIRQLAPPTGRFKLYTTILTSLALVNLVDDLAGRPEKIEPSEYIIGAGIILYETIAYIRSRKAKNS